MSETATVAVIGAGPAGLTTALALRALGVTVRVLTDEPEDRVRPGSRALYVHRDSLRTFERIRPGLGHQIADHGIQWSGLRTSYGDRLVYTKDFPPRSETTGLPPYTSLRQIDTEAHLLQACHDAQVEFDWSARIEKVLPDAGGAEVSADDGRSWHAEYVVAADGARSATRTAIGRTMDGGRSESYHVVVDLADDPQDPDPAHRTFHYHHPGVDGRHVLVVPFAGGRQIDLQCRHGEDPEDFLTADALQDWLPQVVTPDYLDRILWASRYPFLQLVADSFTDEHRRVLLVGEAAHLFAPFGARGMNSAIADADAAAIAVGTALSARTPERARSAVEDYDRLRRAAAVRNRDAAATALAHMRPASRSAKLRQQFAARAARFVPAFGNWLEKAPYGPRTPATPVSTY